MDARFPGQAKKQTTVATSSSEAEYMALSAAVSEAIWIRGLLQDLHQIQNEAAIIFEDNKGCIGMATNLETKRSKHIDIKHHFIRDHIQNGLIEVKPIGTKDQLADMLTKSLDSTRFQDLCQRLGIND